VEMVTEKFGILPALILHDRAVHGSVLVHEDSSSVVISVESNLASVLPLAVAISAAGSTSSSNAAVLALVLAVGKGIGDALERQLTVNTGEGSTINAVIVAGLVQSDIGLATIASIVVAVSVADSAVEDAVTTSIKVSSITVAVGDDTGVVNVVEAKVDGVAEELLTVEARTVGSDNVLAELVDGVEAILTEVALGLRAEVRLGTTRSRASQSKTTLAPAGNILATVTRVGVAILVVVETTGISGEASGLERASTSARGTSTTLAEDLREFGPIDVVLLRKKEIRRPNGTVPAGDG
jgi:hypothetical protein